MCGDWARADIFRAWPEAVALELASFIWPIREVSELLRLLATRHATPVSVCGGEFTASVRAENERVYREVTLSVDLRDSLIPGVHACLDMRLVLLRKRWLRAYLFPPCTHQTLSDTTSWRAKQQDGRMFYGILFVIWCYCVCALMLLVEQPRTRVPDFFMLPTQCIRSSEVGDDDDKGFCFFERGRARLPRTHPPQKGSGHRNLHDFANADERDRERSSWRRVPKLTALVVAAPLNPLDVEYSPSFHELRERFAVAWHNAGLPVPYDYDLRDDALPLLAADREYLAVRGKGEQNKVVRSTVPRSLRGPVGVEAALVTFSPDELDLHQLDLREVTAQSIALCFVAMQTVPLVFAYLNGFTVLGATFSLPTPRGVGLAIATTWAERTLAASSSTFLAGEYEAGARLFATPTNYHPPAIDVVRTPAQRRDRLRAGATFAWCTLAALAGCVAYDPMARATAACAALRGPVSAMADAAIFGHPLLSSFSIGSFASAPIVDLPDPFQFAPSSLEAALSADWRAARELKERLLELAVEDPDLGLWAEKIQPPQLQDIPDGFLETLPNFDDPRLAAKAFVPDYQPPLLPRLLPRPNQSPLGSQPCARSVFDLMPDPTARRVRTWLYRALDDLVCIRDYGIDCERKPPATMVVGPADLYPWARHHVYDFRRSPAECAVALDYSAPPLDPTLNAAFFSRELRLYPNQRLLGMIEQGVVYMADVELQSLFARHLISLPKGFKAVGKELRRLRQKGWYDFTPHIPFWPIYFNAQGSQARKLEPDRDRRTTEGGAPRNDLWDSSGIKVISINEASRAYHMPRHYATDARPEFLLWLKSRHLPPSPEDLDALLLTHGSKWGLQAMPNIRSLSLNLAVLKCAAIRLGMALYIFGNDVADFFNHLVNAASELPLMNLVFLGEDGDLSPEDQIRAFSKDGASIVFVAERRMGFGIHPNSGIAQDLSEAIDHIFRRRMDAVEDPINRADTRPAMQKWLAERTTLEQRVGGHQRRLYTCLTYCDDNIVGVVGVSAAIRSIRLRREIEQEAGLIMAIPKKRMLGTWGLWLGILIFSSLGCVIVPRAKLLRAAETLQRTLKALATFDEYRSAMGLLEHIRHALFMPRRIMHGLYAPHGPAGASAHGPSTIVRPDLFMSAQIAKWLELLASRAGSFFTLALRRADLHTSSRLTYFASSDAATDSSPPGMGGYMHGYYWYLALLPEVIHWLHISVLEFMATGFSTIVYGAMLPPNARLNLGADASATATTFTRQTESSEMLMIAHNEFLETPDFDVVAARADLGHFRGDSNLASDAVSRANWDVFSTFCNDLRIRPQRVELPSVCHDILRNILAHAIRRGRPVRPNWYLSTPTQIPDHLLSYVAPSQSASQEHVHPGVRELERESKRRARQCTHCGALLPRELFGRGRCPSCVEYDGASNSHILGGGCEGLLTAALDSLWRGDTGVDRIFAYRQLASHLGVANAKRPSFAAIDAVLAVRLWPIHFPRDEDAWRKYEAKSSNFRTWKRMVPHLADSTMRQRYDVASAPLTPQESEEAVMGLATMLLVANREKHAALGRSVMRLANLCSQHCRSCGALLPDPLIPPELAGRGRCPSCSDYDGPLAREPSLLDLAYERDLPRPLSRMQVARGQTAPGVQRPGGVTPSSAPSRLQSARAQGTNDARHRDGRLDRVPVVMIGSQRFAAPLQRDRRTSKRKLAMLEFAHARASTLASQTATPEQMDDLRAAVLATHELAEYGAASGTLDKDDHAWEYWERFCKQYGWDPLISPEFARLKPHEVSQRLAIFQAWVYPQLRGRNQPDAKPRSVFNGYVLAIVRILGREHVPMPKAKVVERNLAGIMRTFKVIYGHEALMPGRKQPFTPAMWARIESLPEGAPLPGRAVWSPLTRLRDRNLLRLGRTLWRTGHRLGEIVWHPSGEINYLTRASLSISKRNGRKIAVPTAEDWRALVPGDSILLAPCTSKSDQFGEEHCPFPSILPFDGLDTDAAAAIRDIELEQPCAPADRKTTPLFSDAQGVPYSYAMLHNDLRALLAALFGSAFSKAFSWHSIRIGLACALCAADAPDAVIQLICRWASPDSLKVYRQLGIEKNVFWVTKAHAVTFDATRVNNLPALDTMDALQEQAAIFADAPSPSPLARAPPVTPRASRSYVIQGGTVQAHPSDREGVVGLTALVPRSFWNVDDVSPDEPALIPCVVVAECAREFLHPDGTRARTYLIEWHSQYFPIKREPLLRVCLSASQRAALYL